MEFKLFVGIQLLVIFLTSRIIKTKYIKKHSIFLIQNFMGVL